MARITIEDCITRIPNRFQLTLAATYRARQLTVGATPLIEGEKDKPTVIALREIAAGKVGLRLIEQQGLSFAEVYDAARRGEIDVVAGMARQ